MIAAVFDVDVTFSLWVFEFCILICHSLRGSADFGNPGILKVDLDLIHATSHDCLLGVKQELLPPTIARALERRMFRNAVCSQIDAE